MFGNKRNLIAAIVVSAVILIGFQVFLAPDQPKRPATPPEAPSQVAPSQVAPSGGVRPSVEAPSAPAPAEAGTPLEREAALAAGLRVSVEAPRLRGSIALKGARIDDVVLKDYREAAAEDSPEIVLFRPRNTDEPYFAWFGWSKPQASAVTLPDGNTVWQADRSLLTPGKPVTLTWDNGEGLKFKQTISVDDEFLFTAAQRIENNSGEPIELFPYSRIARHGTPVGGRSSMFAVNSEEFTPWGMFAHGALGVLAEPDGDDIKTSKVEFSYDDLQENANVVKNGENGWFGFSDKYWLSAFVPDQSSPFTVGFRHRKHNDIDIYQVDYWRDSVQVNPGQSLAVTGHLFVGAKEFDLLNSYEDKLGVPELDKAVDFGLVWFLARPLFYPLDFFYRAIGNFGVAILLLTICIRIVLYPLANKAYSSMSKMRKLQPDMMKIRERFKDDKQRMNQEVMAMYRREKANPAAGCLPMLVQIPVFFALYSVLFATIEMRHAPFFGWIDDLSAPDPWTFITAFGYVDWPAPDFLLVGIWPIAFAFTMWLQMKLNPQPVEPMQQKIMMFLPVIFLFLFAQFPAGLVVYWTWNNVLSIGQQWLIMRRMGITRASLAADAAKIKAMKERAASGLSMGPSKSRPGTKKRRAKPASRADGGSARRKSAPKKPPSGRPALPAKATAKAKAKAKAKARGRTRGKSQVGGPPPKTESTKPSRRQRRAAKAAAAAEPDEAGERSAERDNTDQSAEWEDRTKRRERPRRTRPSPRAKRR